ncbi:MAG TPA: PEP-CTERM sorting domain-containing protein [Lacipirellulaceae bacterium]|jgi:hypothetical protein|nr:PEP-CTERM sorting domain-containing protein [Lacipirellulaceae bacterium]
MILTRALRDNLTVHTISFRSAVAYRWAVALLLAVIAVAANPVARAATINYGNFGPVPPGVSFLQVTESSGTDPVPLYGPPTPFATGLDFDPAAFVASANGGGADITDGQLNFTVASSPNIGIGNISLFEGGDYTLAGSGTTATQVLAGAIITATVTEINGAPVAPFNLPSSNASVGFNLVANPGIVQPWTLGTGFNINLPPGQLATKVEFAIDNSLVALSESGSIAFIAKKDFRIDIMPRVPEPATIALLGLGSVITLIRRRFRS